MPDYESTKPLTADEQKFVRLFEREQFCHEKIAVVERIGKLGKGTGLKMLRRKHVAQEVDRRKRLLEVVQVTIDAREQTEEARAQEKRVKVTLDLAEKALHDILQLDAKEHGETKLAGIHTALVWSGEIKNKTMERVAPVGPAAKDGPNPEGSTGYYASIFDAMRPVPQAEPAELMPAPDSPYAPLVLPPKYQTQPPAQASAEPPAQTPQPPSSGRRMKIG